MDCFLLFARLSLAALARPSQLLGTHGIGMVRERLIVIDPYIRYLLAELLLSRWRSIYMS